MKQTSKQMKRRFVLSGISLQFRVFLPQSQTIECEPKRCEFLKKAKPNWKKIILRKSSRNSRRYRDGFVFFSRALVCPLTASTFNHPSQCCAPINGEIHFWHFECLVCLIGIESEVFSKLVTYWIRNWVYSSFERHMTLFTNRTQHSNSADAYIINMIWLLE